MGAAATKLLLLLAGGFFARGFFAAGFFAAGFLAIGSSGVGSSTVGFLAAGFLAAGFLAAGFLTVASPTAGILGERPDFFLGAGMVGSEFEFETTGDEPSPEMAGKL